MQVFLKLGRVHADVSEFFPLENLETLPVLLIDILRVHILILMDKRNL